MTASLIARVECAGPWHDSVANTYLSYKYLKTLGSMWAISFVQRKYGISYEEASTTLLLAGIRPDWVRTAT